MNQIKTWQQRQAETGIGSVEAKDDEIRELRQAIEQAGKATPEHDALIAEMRVTAPIWEGYVGDMLRSAADKLEAYALAAPQRWTSAEQEVHDALCPALTGGKCSCSSSPATVDKAWSQFCGGIGRGPDAPYPGMIQAFEAHYGQSFTDKDWRNETGIWAAAWGAAWGYAVRQENAAPTAPAQPDMTHCANEWADATMSALDGLRNVRDGVSTPDQVIAILEANIDHCRGVTAPAQPVFWCFKDSAGRYSDGSHTEHSKGMTALYAAAPAQQPLTDEQIAEIWHYNQVNANCFARAIEAHIKGASL